MKNIVGVCACPAGIAHTYLAAETLENTAKNSGYNIKVETNGSGGVENRLSDEDIAKAEYVVIAADTKVEMERFRGKKLIEVSVTEAIRNPKELFEKINNDELEVY